jgi:hypothetical protein
VWWCEQQRLASAFRVDFASVSHTIAWGKGAIMGQRLHLRGIAHALLRRGASDLQAYVRAGLLLQSLEDHAGSELRACSEGVTQSEWPCVSLQNTPGLQQPIPSGDQAWDISPSPGLCSAAYHPFRPAGSH